MAEHANPLPDDDRPAEHQAVSGPAHRAEVLAELHRWSTAALTAGADVPVFGSRAWCALEDRDPAKSFAADRAALAWWMEQVYEAEERAADHVAASHDVCAAADWAAVARRPSFAELERRRRGA